MTFEAQLDGFDFLIDADEKAGGQSKGPKPKGLTLVSLAGCTAMDVISILGKMRVSVDSFEVAIDGVLAREHPRKFLEVLIKYIFKGTDLPLGKIKKAIHLSMENYCGVSATLRPVVKLSHQIIINDSLYSN
jgi:putative redox protein